jgi:hypothetical protein
VKDESGWIDAGTPPDESRQVLASVFVKGRDNSRRYMVSAIFIRAKSWLADCDFPEDWCDYDEAKDDWYLPEGWYLYQPIEESAMMLLISGAVTHWRELPQGPEVGTNGG